MAQMHEIEVWVMVDEAGDYVTAVGEDLLAERYAEDVGAEGRGTRIVCIKMKVALPKTATIELTAPDEDDSATASVGEPS